MESIIGLREANCKNCYKCIRSCPVKSLNYGDEQVRIVDAECIYCGNCVLQCPQKAKVVNSDLPRVRRALKAGEKLYVSLAPAYVGAFPDYSLPRLSAALRKLGFIRVEETAIGASPVTREYEKLIRAHRMRNIIATSCPSLNLLVEKYYPELVDQLAPVASPLLAHARMIRQIYGPRARVVFIGPCIAKKYEVLDPESGNAIFAVLTFPDLLDWLKEAGIHPDEADPEGRGMANPLPRYYPAPGGVIQNLGREFRRPYECVSIDGADRCIEALDSIRDRGLSGYFLEMNICAGGCLGGPAMRMLGASFLPSKEALLHEMRRPVPLPPALTEGTAARFTRKFHGMPVPEPPVDEQKIREVLAMTGKTSPEKELNCGCCGYNTCREKAIAVIRGKADIRMCVPYMRELAECMSSTVVENIPIGVLILNGKLEITHINPAATRMLRLQETAVGRPVGELLACGDFARAVADNRNILHHKVTYSQYGLRVEQSVVVVRESDLVLVLLSDITDEERSADDRRRQAEENAEIARDVINRQMRVVQEIAGLLGETTTDTKLALARLTHVILPDGEDGHGTAT